MLFTSYDENVILGVNSMKEKKLKADHFLGCVQDPENDWDSPENAASVRHYYNSSHLTKYTVYKQGFF